MNRFLLFFILFISLQTYSQEYKFREVSKAELSQTKSFIDTSAVAEVLYVNIEAYYDITGSGLEMVTNVHKRIKFYSNSPEATKHATEEVTHQIEGEKVSKIKAYTYNLVGNEIEETELDKDQIFENEINKHRKKVSFTMPKILPGSIVDFKYTVRSTYIMYVDDLKLQYDIPLRKLEATYLVPENINLMKYPRGYHIPNFSEDRKYDARIGMEANQYTFSIDKVPALKEEKYVNNMENYRAAIIFEIQGIKYANGSVKSYSSTWNDVAYNILDSDDYKFGIKRDNVFKEEIQTMVAHEESDYKKMQKIYQYVKNNVKWNKYYGKFFDNGIRSTFKEKTGNVADINLSLVAMLRHANLTANPVLLTTRDNLIPSFPNISHLNYVIALVQIEGEYYYLDATEFYAQPNILPIRDYNWLGLLIDTENNRYKQINLVEPPKTKETFAVNITLDEGNKAQGSVREIYDNHYAYLVRKNYFSSSEENFLIEKENKYDIKIQDYKYDGMQGNEELKQEYKFSADKIFDRVDENIIFNPLFFKKMSASPFVSEERKYPIDFVFPFQDNLIVNIKIPDGYEIVEQPESKKINFGDIGHYSYIVNVNNQFVRVTTEFNLNKAAISSDNYQALKQFYDQVVSINENNIVLEKKS